MQEPVWNRAAQASLLVDRIWRFVSPATVRAEEVLPLAATLLQLPQRDRGYLAAIHLLLAPESQALLTAAPGLLRRLTSSSRTVLDEHPETIRGPIDWPATWSLAAARGTRIGYVTRPTERVLSTPENRLLAASLQVVVDASRQLRWAHVREGVGVQVREHELLAARLRASSVLRTVPTTPDDRDAWRVRRGRAARRFRPVADFWDLHQDLQHPNTARLRAMIETSALIAASDGTLLELVALFALGERLEAAGWVQQTPELIRGSATVRYRRGTDTTTLHVQGTPVDVHDTYTTILRQHAVPGHRLRPDIVVDFRSAALDARVLVIVEVKYRRRAADGARTALLDSLAYRETYRDTRAQYVGCYWGREGVAVPGADVLLCSIDQLPNTVLSLLPAV